MGIEVTLTITCQIMEQAMYAEIPENEYQRFQSFVQVYQKGAVIVSENDLDDKGLFLLRRGAVAVYKGKGKSRELISKIEALNFFGEMAIIAGGPRSASVEALTDNTIVYAFQTPDLDALMSNPTWGRMLVTRLSKDLKQSNSLIMELREQVRYQKEEIEKLYKGSIEVFSVTSEIQKSIANDAVATAREWKYLSGIVELVQKLLRSRLPEVADHLNTVEPETWKALYDEGICPEIIYNHMKKANQP
jgi:CRP-like cAMP-binding protein